MHPSSDARHAGARGSCANAPLQRHVHFGELAGEFGDRATTRARFAKHSHGEGLADAGLPDVVVFPHSNEEVAAIVRLCQAARVPVIAFGVGTSLEGHVAALYGGVCIDLSQMNRVLEINAADLDCRVQAGVTREQLNAELKGTGLFFPIDPGANATIGGMAATRASGTNAVRYGTMRDNVLGLTVVTADGRIIHTGGRARKSSAGYDLTRLFVGAEGTLGVITEIRLRLYGVPEAIAAAVCQFTISQARQHRHHRHADGHSRRAHRTARRRADGRLHPLFATQGFAVKHRRCSSSFMAPAGVGEQSAAMQAIEHDFGGSAFQWATLPGRPDAPMEGAARGLLCGAGLEAGMPAFATDACVPISRLADCMHGNARPTSTASGMTAPIVGHVGDGNFHLVVLFDPSEVAERATAEALATRRKHARHRDGRHLHRRARHRHRTSSTRWSPNTVRRST